MKHFLFACLGCFSQLFLSAQDSPQYNIKLRFLDRFETGPEIEQTDSFRRLQIMIAGNIYQTPAQQNLFFTSSANRFDFSDEFRYVQPIFHIAQLVIANLQTSFGNNPESPYSAPDEFALALKFAGINNLVNANYSTANIDKFGLERTRKLLGHIDLDLTGVYSGNIERNAYNPQIIDKNGFRIALINYTTLPDRPSISNNFILNQADKTLIAQDLRLAQVQKADYIIVYLDWSNDNKDFVQPQQEALVKFCFDNGADLVVGTAPGLAKRMDPVDYIKNGQKMTGIAVYSLGNLIGNPELPGGRNGAILDIEITKNNYTGITRLHDFGFIPIYNYYDSLSKPNRLYAVPVSAIESKEILKNIPFVEQRRSINAAYVLRKLYGTVSDEVQYNLTDRAVNDVQEIINITQAPLNNKQSMFREEKLGDLQTSLRELRPRKPLAPKDSSALKTKPGVVPPLAKTPGPRAPKRKTSDNDTVYCIQFYSLPRPTNIDTFYYDHLAGYRIEEDGQGNYLYLLGHTPYFTELYAYWKEQIRPRYRRSFLVAYHRGVRVREYPQDF